MKAARLHLFLPKTWTQGIRKIVAVSLCFLLTWLPALAQTQGQPPQTAESTSAQVPLTNKDVLDLFKMGLSEDIIIAKIRSTPSKFDTSPAALQELITANVPQSVILAMILGNVEAPPAQAKLPRSQGSSLGSLTEEHS